MKREIAAAVSLATTVVTASVWATNEQWYGGQVGCDGPNFDIDDLYYSEPYGWTTSLPYSSIGRADLVCPQPHLFGNSGYAASPAAKVYDSSNDDNVSVYMCRTVGSSTAAADSYSCDSVTTSNNSLSPTGMTFPNTSDSVRSHYYWWISLPGDDTNGGGVGDGQSYFVGYFFTDN
jgi:hypothetical protein